MPAVRGKQQGITISRRRSLVRFFIVYHCLCWQTLHLLFLALDISPSSSVTLHCPSPPALCLHITVQSASANDNEEVDPETDALTDPITQDSIGDRGLARPTVSSTRGNRRAGFDPWKTIRELRENCSAVSVCVPPCFFVVGVIL